MVKSQLPDCPSQVAPPAPSIHFCLHNNVKRLIDILAAFIQLLITALSAIRVALAMPLDRYRSVLYSFVRLLLTKPHIDETEVLKLYAAGVRDFRRVNLSGAKLNGANLSNADLSDADLGDADLSRANLNGAKLNGVKLNGAKLNHANVNFAFLKGADLSGADLSAANLVNSDLRDANLRAANLINVNLIATNLVNANLTNSNLHCTNLSEAKLSEANLSGADLSLANLYGATLEETNLSGASLQEAILNFANLRGASLQKANLRIADLRIANLFKADLTEANLCRAILSYSNLSEANLRGANLRHADLSEALLVRTDLSDADLYDAKLENASNQGIGGKYTWAKLRFSSQPQMNIAQALERAGVLFYPNCKARVNTSDGRETKESDFLVCHQGKFGILEVDCSLWPIPSSVVHDPEGVSVAASELPLFKDHGIRVVEHYDASRCFEEPDSVVQEFLQILVQE